VRNAQVLDEWEELLRTRRSVCRDLWDHVATKPTTAIGTRYQPLAGTQAWVDYQGETLRQWQYEIDRRARVKIGVGKDYVVVVSVSAGHPKENE
jgi:hypothetical protein